MNRREFFLCGPCGREKKCSAGFQPAKVLLTQKKLSRLTCRRDAGATIFSHDLCLRGENKNALYILRSRACACIVARTILPALWRERNAVQVRCEAILTQARHGCDYRGASRTA